LRSQVRGGLTFSDFVDASEAPLRHALIAQFGGETGREAASEALLYGLENWDRIGVMDNPAGYLFRVGQRWGRRSRPRTFSLGVVHSEDSAWFEPGLVPALDALSDKQRVAVVLRHGSDMGYSEIAELTGMSETAVRKNVERALAALRKALEVSGDE
jgi:RNA polymerase sigma factor (sigma-70 family)